MEDSTIGTIYALKHVDKSYDDSVIEFWSKYTETPPEYYRTETLMKIAKMVMEDYMNTADNPRLVMYCLLENMRFDCEHLIKEEETFDDRVRRAIWETLTMTKVKDDNGNYVNGFRELEEE